MMTPSKILLGCIADDFTGATDLANNLVRSGMRVLQTIGVPPDALTQEVDAVVVALKSRTIAPQQAIEQSLAALHWLREQGAQQIYFKYCSTFDSTPQGNIGPVLEALMDAMGVDFTIATPAFPDNQRTVFKGYLFVGDMLLHESGMKNHPLTPMTDSSLVRVLQAQSKRRVGLIDYTVVAQGAQAVKQKIAQLRTQGVGLAVVDALSNDDLLRVGPAWAELPLLSAGSGVAIALPANFGIQPSPQAASLPPPRGHQAIVCGSCSLATQAQVQHFMQHARSGAQEAAAFEVDVWKLVDEADAVVQQALAWAAPLLAHTPVLVYSTADAARVREVQQRLGVERAGALVEQTLAQIACGLVALGVGQLIVAGGETSGACVQALGIRSLRIGSQIAPGVPWCYAPDSQHRKEGLHITLKSGNFGGEDFLTSAFACLE